jgi:cytochrome c
MKVVLPIALLLMAGCYQNQRWERARQLTGGDPVRGGQRIAYYGCPSCHTIPGIREADGLVGPPLTRIARRNYVAGLLPNNAGNLVHWIRQPQQVQPGSAMPDLNVTEQDARDIAAYLYTLE